MNFEQAVKLHQTGELDKARQAYAEILEKEPLNSAVLNLMGVLLLQKGETDSALKHLEQAVELNPCAPYLENYALGWFCKGEFLKAAQNYEKALEKEETLHAHEQAQKCYEKLGMFDKVLVHLEKIHEFRPDDIDCVRKIASLYKTHREYEKAIEFYEKSIQLVPDDYIAMNNEGLCYEGIGEFCKAKCCYERSLEVRKNYEAFHNLGVLCRKFHDFDGSIELLKKALLMKPDSIESKVSLGMSYLSKKDFHNGYKYYVKRNPKLRAQYKNPWDGKKHPDKTLLIHFDGGHGDQLMFCRYLRYLEGWFKEIKLLVYPGLLDLFKFNFPDLTVMLPEQDFTPYDYSVNIMELHYNLGMDFEHIPAFESYLCAPEERISFFKERYFDTDRRKIGLFWQGNPKVFKNRAIPLKKLEPLFGHDDIEFYSLEKGDSLNQIEDFPKIVNLEPELNSFSDTAGALMNLDLLITIDTGIAHLAGALGVKTYLLLPYSSEWRWFSDTEKTPWYPNFTLFKQEKEGDWEEVVKRIDKALD